MASNALIGEVVSALKGIDDALEKFTLDVIHACEDSVNPSGGDVPNAGPNSTYGNVTVFGCDVPVDSSAAAYGIGRVIEKYQMAVENMTLTGMAEVKLYKKAKQLAQA